MKIKIFKEDYRNLILLLIPVMICILVFLIKLPFEDSLVLKMNNVTLWNWFTNIFLHQNFTHIFMNMLIYFFAIISAYILTPRKDKNKFILIFYILIFLIPLLTVLLLIYFRNIGLFPSNLINSKGFSGITAGSLGILGFTISKRIYLEMKQKRSFNRLMFCSDYIFIPTLAIMVINISLLLAGLIGLAWLFIVGIFIIPILIRTKKKKEIVNIGPINIKPIIVPMIILFIGCLLMVPKNLVSNGSAINTPAHLFGYSIGFILSFIINYFFIKE